MVIFIQENGLIKALVEMVVALSNMQMALYTKGTLGKVNVMVKAD